MDNGKGYGNTDISLRSVSRKGIGRGRIADTAADAMIGFSRIGASWQIMQPNNGSCI